MVQAMESDPEASHGRLKIHFADEEGDPFSVELAARLRGFVVGNDSDFVVLNADGYQGYVPMQQMVWSAANAEEESSIAVESDGDFQTVVAKSRRKAHRKQAGEMEGLIPPHCDGELQLSVVIYSPSRLATHLQLPVSLLPLLGALVGNDFTGAKEASVTTSQRTNLQWLFFDRALSNSQRITRVATTLRSILDAALTAPAKGKQKIQINSVMQLIERAVTTLMVRSAELLSTGEREQIVERIVEATLQYAIPKHELDADTDGLWSSPLCPLHDEDTCILVKYLSKPLPADTIVESEPDLQTTVRNLYITAYRAGDVDPRMFDVVHTGSFWHRQFLENPDYESVGRSIARLVHELIYAVLDDAFVLPDNRDEVSDVEEDEEDEELIDVVEESDDEDPLAPLRGALQQLNGSVDDLTADSVSVSSSNIPPPPAKGKFVMEYLRRGTRVTSEEVTIPALRQVLRQYDIPVSSIPLQLRSEDDRFTFLLRALRSDIIPIRTLPPQQLIIALAIRWTVSTIDLRARSNGSKERVKERWTKQEARCFIASFIDLGDLVEPDAPPPIMDRNVQLVAQIMHAFVAIVRLAQILLLQNRVVLPAIQFSGQVFHEFLTNMKPVPPGAVSAALWDATVHGLDDAFSESEKTKRKREQAKGLGSDQNGRTQNNRRTGPGKGAAVKGGMFGLLASMDA
ncbi:hypothetical protein EUX98_g3321 [Antrodiella citrinella]|uniref:Asteroid domain-containing protein n=1 Tax=Antrodiella citrinella TaxID=2447956 RepID=A0A4S4MWV5_9APHY|nr:hypothetical protein EUX98_g3321 [Antrodiella citrinella]